MNGILKVSLGISCGNTKANGPMTGGDLKAGGITREISREMINTN